MIITGRTISQLPTLSSITSGATLILQTGNTTFKANLSEFAKSPVFGSMYQDLIPVSSNTFSIGTTGSTIKTLYVTSGSVIVGQSGIIGIDSSGNTYSTSGISTPSLFIGNVTTEGVKSTGTTINIVSGDTIFINSSGETVNFFKQIVPTGGSISQVLSKNSGNDYDFDWQNLQGIYITGATSNGGGLDIYQSATTSTLAFKTITSITPTHITIGDSNGLLRISGTGLLSVSNNGAGAFVAQSGTSSTFALRSLSSQTPSNLTINASGDLILFSGKTFYDSASNGSGGGNQVLQTSTIPNLVFRTLSSSTPNNLTLSTSGNLILFSGKTNNLFSAGTGNVLLISSITSNNDVIQKSISAGTNINIIENNGTLIFSAKTFITGATNNGSGIQVFQSADTQTLAFRSLSSTTSALTINASGNHVLFNMRPKYYGAFSDYNTQSATTNNVGVPFLFRSTDLTNGVTIVSNSRITFPTAAVYNLQWSGQFENIGNSEQKAYVWLRRQGNDVLGSTGIVTIHRAQGVNYGTLLPSWNFLIDVTSTTDYYEIIWATDSAANLFLKYYSGSTGIPSTASLVLTLTEI